MGLINLYTDLKSLKFGKDRIGGGSSNQPYIKTPIPEKIGEFGYLNQDFILRGGSKALTNSASDVIRLGKYFTDTSNPSGLLFTVKQNLLSRMAVRTQASTGLLNEGVYTPLSTLIEAGGVAFGLHVNKQGLNPFGGFGGITKYEDAVRLTNTDTIDASVITSTTTTSNGNGGQSIASQTTSPSLRNRLVGLWNDKVIISNTDLTNILSYRGGPGSGLGIGSTNIKFAGSSASERTGVNNPLQIDKPGIFFGNTSTLSEKFEYLTRNGKLKSIGDTNSNTNVSRFLGLSIYGWDYSISDVAGVTQNLFIVKDKTANILKNNSIVSPNFTPTPSINFNDSNNSYSSTYSPDQLVSINQDTKSNISSYIGRIGTANSITTPGDFRALLRSTSTEQRNLDINVGNLIAAPDYTTQNISQRVNLGDPGNRNGKNLSSYTSGSTGYNGAASFNSYDKINALPLYKSTSVDGSDVVNDLVKFRIGVIDNENPDEKIYIHFRAFLNNISDAYNADWNSTKYIGRGENFYTYGGFDRKVSLSWTVAAQSKAELIPMYKKLNYLASVITPDYSPNGYMRGNMVTLTIGGYFYEQPGIITGFNYEMNDENSTWEIGINDEGESDSSVKELPHMIKVTGFNFIPIHTFVPRKQNIVNEVNKKGLPDNILGDTNGYGPERYIALEAITNNYGEPKPWATPPPPNTPTVTPKVVTPVIVEPKPTQNFPNVLAAPTGLTTPVTNNGGGAPIVTTTPGKFNWNIDPNAKVYINEKGKTVAPPK